MLFFIITDQKILVDNNYYNLNQLNSLITTQQIEGMKIAFSQQVHYYQCLHFKMRKYLFQFHSLFLIAMVMNFFFLIRIFILLLSLESFLVHLIVYLKQLVFSLCFLFSFVHLMFIPEIMKGLLYFFMVNSLAFIIHSFKLLVGILLIFFIKFFIQDFAFTFASVI